MSTKNTIIKGTMILTISGIISRLLGFYYKIFLSDAIGLESFGLYQMTLPVAGLCMSVCSGGIQTALQKHVASCNAGNQNAKSHGFLNTALLTSICTLIPISLILYTNAGFIAGRFIGNAEAAPLLQITALSLFPACVHSCVNAYFLGCSKTLVPSVSQLLEQIVRVCAVYIIITAQINKGIEVTAASGVAGMLFGEIASSLYSVTVYLCKKGRLKADSRNTFRPLFTMSVPLTANRFLLHLFQSIEAVLIPTCMCLNGNSYSHAVSTYGIITGMAMPLIMLPSTFINSFAVMLLPAVSAAQSDNNSNNIKRTVQFSMMCCIYIGILCTAEFIMFGNEAGMLLFGEESLGTYIRILAWLCPFMYLTATFTSILNGLGKTKITFGINMSGTIIRILIIIILAPVYGIRGVLMAFLISQLCTAGINYFFIKKSADIDFNAVSLILIPCICAFFASAVSRMLYDNLLIGDFSRLMLSGSMLAVMYLLIIFSYERVREN